MMELLRRFEEDAAHDEDIGYKEASGIGEENSLADKFIGLDLGRQKDTPVTTLFDIFQTAYHLRSCGRCSHRQREESLPRL